MLGIARAAQFRKLARAVMDADEQLDKYERSKDEPPAELVRQDRSARDAMIRWLSQETTNDADPIFADDEFVAAIAMQADSLIIVRRSKVMRLFRANPHAEA